jgi:hypothetical protein
MSNVGRPIVYMKVHSGEIFLKGPGTLGSVLPSPSKSLKLVMYGTEEGVFLSFNGGKTEAVVPWANVQIVEYGPRLEVQKEEA